MPQNLLDSLRLSVNHAARRVGVHPSTLWRWILTGTRNRKLPSVAVGGRRYVLVADLEAFLAQGLDSPGSVAPRVTHEGRAQAAADALIRRGV